MNPIPFREIGDVYQYLEVKPGEKKEVFTFELPVGYVGFITEMYINWFPNTYSYLYIDSFPKMKIEWIIGDVSSPKPYYPPILVRRKIQVISYNNDSYTHYFDAMIDGVAYDFAYELRRFRYAKVNS